MLTRLLKIFIVGAVLAALAACGGSGAPTQQLQNTSTPTVSDYSGPAPQSADVESFKNNFWVNIKVSNRCGGCHFAGGQTPSFARSDDVNLAYQAALQVVNLAEPDQSRVVIKVGGGHNCWQSSPSACADILTTWIRNWAGSAGSGGQQIKLVAPPDKSVGSSKTFPADSSLFASTIYPILHHQNPQYCARCHNDNAATPQQPFFASDSVDEAYAEAQAKIDLDTPSNSRFVVRLRDEFHNCWSDCATDAQMMLDAITAFANGIQPTQVDPSLVISKALTMYDGTIASGGNRYVANEIALYEFKTGSGTTAFDTSGVDPEADLNLSGSVSWVGGWGISIGTGGKAQALTTASAKLFNRITASGEYTFEVWAAPANVAQENANIVSYSGGTKTRNATLGQHDYQYEAFNRSDKTDANGSPSLLSAATRRDAQASLQHVVMTYDPVNGRRLYVNGSFTGDVDPSGGGSLSSWDNTFALVLGNETSDDRQWLGAIKMVAIHDRALTLDQIQQNFAAGVGERYFLLFNVSTLVNLSQSYLMFEVSQYDSYSYLFNKPTFISLDPTVTPGSIPIRGIRIGLNGAEVGVGQAYIPLNVTLSAANYNSTAGELLSSLGTVIPLQKGPNADLFFLTFEQIGSNSHAVTDPVLATPAPPADSPPQSDIGLRVFSQLNASMSKVTGVPTTNASVQQIYNTVQQQLPSISDINTFVSAQQVGVTQLAVGYCSAMVDDNTLRGNFFPGFNMSAATLASSGERALVINPLIANTMNTNVATQPDPTAVSTELNNLIVALCPGGTCATSRTPTVVKALCTAALASAAVTIE